MPSDLESYIQYPGPFLLSYIFISKSACSRVTHAFWKRLKKHDINCGENNYYKITNSFYTITEIIYFNRTVDLI
jgi:hypothetical protein